MAGAGQREAGPIGRAEGERAGSALQRRRELRPGGGAVAGRARVEPHADTGGDGVDLHQPGLAAAGDQRGVEADGATPNAGAVAPERTDAKVYDLARHGRAALLAGADQAPDGMRTTTAPTGTRRISSAVCCEMLAFCA